MHRTAPLCAYALTATVGLAAAPHSAPRNQAPKTSHIWSITGEAVPSAPIRFAGHVYAGAAGDLVLVPEGAVRPNLRGVPEHTPLWLSSNFLDPCGDFVEGATGDGINPFLGIFETTTDSDCSDCGDPFTDIAAVDHGDIPFDSLITAMRVFLGTTEPTPDTDGDGLPDALANTSFTVTFIDNDDGYGFGASFGTAVASFNLPILGDPDPDDAEIAVYDYFWDLTNDFDSSLGVPLDRSFTLGNTGQAADIDSDGLADVGWSFLPEYQDIDGNGREDIFATFMYLAPPVGDVTMVGGTYTDFAYEVRAITPPQGTGATEDIDVYTTDPAGVQPPLYLGTITGFTTDADPDGIPNSGDEARVRGFNCDLGTPIANLAFELYTGEAPCPADLDRNGALNNTDITLFVNAFLAADPLADINTDGYYNNTDITLFVNLFIAGCG